MQVAPLALKDFLTFHVDQFKFPFMTNGAARQLIY